MKLDLSAFLANDEKVLDFKGELESNESKYDIDNLNLIFPIQYQGSIYDLESELLLELKLDYKYETNCDRCLKPITQKTNTQLEARHYRTEDKPEDQAMVENFELKDKKLSLDDLIISQIITSRPLKDLCDLDCKGLCPYCGKNLNNDNCDCKEKYEEQNTDPRFEKLMDLFNDEEV
ncbi:MAG: DUF177 domain-containing protein [Tissierellia bacterium]|nr:DUF177 domain-containing protein [Tissierellia bacterium]